MKVRTDMGTTVRDGYLATLNSAPCESYGTILDLYYSTMDQTDNARSLEVNLGGYPAPCCDGPVPGRHGVRLLQYHLEDDTVVAGT